jgi:hypothetical protein
MNRRKRKRQTYCVEKLESRDLMTVSFVFDYTLDQGFFADSTRRDLLNYAGKMVASRITDSLQAITPSGSNTWNAQINHPSTGALHSLGNISIAANKIIVYVGGRELGSSLGIGGYGGFSNAFGSQTWFNTLLSRGQAGALSNPKTDHGPWGGYLAFDTVGTTWHFGKTTSGLTSNEADFLSVATHELAHLLGIASANTSWSRYYSGGFFTGPNVRALNGGVNPTATPGHFGEGTKSQQVEVLMDPSITFGTRKYMSQLDFAMLQDVGWAFNGSANDTIYESQHALTHRSTTTTSDALSWSTAIESSKDVDIYRIYADANTTLSVTVSNASGLDTYVRLFDARGTQRRIANQGAANGNDVLTYNIARSDYYYVAVSSFANRTYSPLRTSSGPGGPTGSYQVFATMMNKVATAAVVADRSTAIEAESTQSIDADMKVVKRMSESFSNSQSRRRNELGQDAVSASFPSLHSTRIRNLGEDADNEASNSDSIDKFFEAFDDSMFEALTF